MPIPTRLANDGWWLCERPSTALVCNFPSRQAVQQWPNSSTPAPHAGSVQGNAFPIKAGHCLALAALADWLFYGQRIGISAVIFTVALTGGALLANFTRLNKAQVLLAGLLVLAGLIPAIEEFNVASLFFIVLALGIGLSLTTNRKLGTVLANKPPRSAIFIWSARSDCSGTPSARSICRR